MINKLIFLVLILISNNLFSQEISGKELLNNAINFHDPMNNWVDFNGSFIVKMITPDEKIRESLRLGENMGV